ncbi:hypothetical protein ACIP98_05410 [Streptomyces sp. NPDC088354]|uniref:hypothetical protein n=1 Tax=unclassified Streptomyces TaxID=2593676 RepID=UPI0029ADFACC|nr:hypothetical protein [Streptomyces sp. MI02-7b]MDX3073712.1 hypothetical protein [Streptomyces sp. MI02-7b]
MSTSRRMRLAAAVGAAAVALIATAGCGAAHDTAKAVGKTDTIAKILARVTDRTEKVGSAQVRFVTDPGQGSPVTMTGTYSWGKGLAYDVMMDTKAAQMQSVQDAPTLRALLVDGAYYYNVDPQPAGPLKGKHWMRVDVSALLGEKGAAAVEKNGDPTAGLRYIGMSKDAEDLGEEPVRGIKAHHYHVTLDKDDLGAGMSAEDKKNLIGSMVGSGGGIDMDVWVDGKDLPVRLIQVMGKVKVTADFLKFGHAKTVTAPPASDTADVSAQVKAAQPGS